MRDNDWGDVGRTGDVGSYSDGRTSGLTQPWLGLIAAADRCGLIMDIPSTATELDKVALREDAGRIYVLSACRAMVMASAAVVVWKLPPWTTAAIYAIAATLASVGLYLFENPERPPAL